MGQEIKIFSGTSGLNNQDDPARLRHDFETGIVELSSCRNIIIDETGMPSTRPGYSMLTAGSFHSLFCDGGDAFVVEDRVDENDAAIFQIASDLTLTGVRSGLTRCARVSYCKVGEETYYSNGYEKGIISGGTSRPWVKGEDDEEGTSVITSGPPTGTHIASYRGRMFISEENICWFSKLWRYDLYEKATCFFRYRSKIRMVRPVEDGIYVSSSNAVYFVSGAFPDEIKSVQVSSHPAVEWTDVSMKVDGNDIGLDLSALGAVWLGEDSVYMGYPGGVTMKVNKSKIKYPPVSQGAGFLFNNSYVHTAI